MASGGGYNPPGGVLRDCYVLWWYAVVPTMRAYTLEGVVGVQYLPVRGSDEDIAVLVAETEVHTAELDAIRSFHICRDLVLARTHPSRVTSTAAF